MRSILAINLFKYRY